MYKKGGILQYYPGSRNHLHAIAIPLASGPIKAPLARNCQGDYTTTATAQTAARVMATAVARTAARVMATAQTAARVMATAQTAARVMAVARVAAAAVAQAAARVAREQYSFGVLQTCSYPFFIISLI